MIYHFKIISHESKDFCLEIDIDSNLTFYDFHNAIQKSLSYESFQLASFFVSDGGWKKLREISLLDLGTKGNAYHIMQKTKISELIHSEEQKLIYTFDFFNDRSFYIELTGIIMGKSLLEPLITRKQGEAPVQVLSEESADYNQVLVLDEEEEEVYMDFGELEDYTEIFGEMDEF